jgi:hypothetical protein
MREPTKHEQRMDSLYDALFERIDDYYLDPQDAIRVVADMLFVLVEDSDHELLDTLLERLPAIEMRLQRLRARACAM